MKQYLSDEQVSNLKLNIQDNQDNCVWCTGWRNWWDLGDEGDSSQKSDTAREEVWVSCSIFCTSCMKNCSKSCIFWRFYCPGLRLCLRWGRILPEQQLFSRMPRTGLHRKIPMPRWLGKGATGRCQTAPFWFNVFCQLLKSICPKLRC